MQPPGLIVVGGYPVSEAATAGMTDLQLPDAIGSDSSFEGFSSSLSL